MIPNNFSELQNQTNTNRRKYRIIDTHATMSLETKKNEFFFFFFLKTKRSHEKINQTSTCKPTKHTYPELENSKSLPVFEKIITATSASQRMANS